MMQERWKRLLKEQKESGKSISAFCRERGMSDSGFGYWKRKLERIGENETFVQVGSCKEVEIVLPGGKAIKVQEQDLGKVLGALCER